MNYSTYSRPLKYAFYEYCALFQTSPADMPRITKNGLENYLTSNGGSFGMAYQKVFSENEFLSSFITDCTLSDANSEVLDLQVNLDRLVMMDYKAVQIMHQPQQIF